MVLVVTVGYPAKECGDDDRDEEDAALGLRGPGLELKMTQPSLETPDDTEPLDGDP